MDIDIALGVEPPVDPLPPELDPLEEPPVEGSFGAEAGWSVVTT